VIDDKATEYCIAFVKGIPEEIFIPSLDDTALFDHRYPHPNDNGIQFEQEDDYSKLKNRVPINLAMRGYTDEENERAYRYLHFLFRWYDDKRQAGVMEPKIQIAEDSDDGESSE
jgi:hypothetical protein